MICNAADVVQALLAQGIIVRAEALFAADSIEYIMYAPQFFRELTEGEIVPKYTFTVDTFEAAGEGVVGYHFEATEWR
jgi:hypothetical protein